MPSNYLILCCPLLLLPSILLRVFSNESVLPIRWPKVLKFHVVGLNCARLFATPWSLWAPLSMEFSRQQYLSYIYIYSLLTSISPYSSFLFPFLSMYIPSKICILCVCSLLLCVGMYIYIYIVEITLNTNLYFLHLWIAS